MIDKEKIEAALKALGKCEWHPTSCDGAVSAGYDCDDASDFLTAHHGTIRQALEAQMAGGWNHDMSAAPQREPICAPRTVRYMPYKPDGARQMGKPGRWQEWNGYGWSNCEDDPTCWQSLPPQEG